MRILGIDPGTHIVGYGVIDNKAGQFKTIAYGVVQGGKALPLPQRLKAIYNGLKRVIKQYQPQHIVVENVFYSKNAQATIKMGEGRGVALLCAADTKCEIFEYTPAEIKKAVTGNGRAHKSQVQVMVRHILNLTETPKSPDAADALAIAICHSYRGG